MNPRTTVLLLLALLAPASLPAQDPAGQAGAPHFPLAADLRALAALGDAERTRILARATLDDADAFATLDETGVPGMQAGAPASGGAGSPVEALRNALRRVVDAPELDDLTFAVAETGAACGACHQSAGMGGDAGLELAAPEVTGSTRHGGYLAWASRLLWEGLALPSERAWRVGAGALIGTGSYPVPSAGHVPAAANEEAATQLDALAVQAVTASEPRIRADLLARMWVTCADCHQAAGVGR